jgi:hypothetical protein
MSTPAGPQEVRTVGLDVNRMRERILAESVGRPLRRT